MRTSTPTPAQGGPSRPSSMHLPACRSAAAVCPSHARCCVGCSGVGATLAARASALRLPLTFFSFLKRRAFFPFREVCLSRKEIHASIRSKSVPFAEQKRKMCFPFRQVRPCLSRKQIHASTRSKSVSLAEQKRITCSSLSERHSSRGTKKTNVFFSFYEACLSRKQNLYLHER